MDRDFVFDFTCRTDLPRLAWYLVLPDTANRVRVVHGPWVETGPTWFCEGAWAGKFSDGDFHCKFMTGTGARVTGEGLELVCPNHTLDRVLTLRKGGFTYASNSFALLLCASGESLDYNCLFYDGLWTSSRDGTRRYWPTMPTASGNHARLYYYGNVLIDGRRKVQVARKPGSREFVDFADYTSCLRDTALALAANAADSTRNVRFELLTTMSGGYDSPAVAVIARAVGCRQAITFTSSRHGMPGEDCGTPIAAQLGLKVREFGRLDYRNYGGFPEIENSGGPNEFVSFGKALSGKLLFTGFMGGTVWDKHANRRNCDFVRTDASGASFTELRLRVGFHHLPVPYIGGDRLAAIQRISNSAEMQPWTLHNNYDRPIPRRIVEEGGVSRGTFGVKKRAAGVTVSEEGLETTMSEGSLTDFRAFVDKYWNGDMRNKVLVARMLRILSRGNERLVRMIARIARNVGLDLPKFPMLVPSRLRAMTYGYLGREALLFHWGVDKLMERYSKPATKPLSKIIDPGSDTVARRA